MTMKTLSRFHRTAAMFGTWLVNCRKQRFDHAGAGYCGHYPQVLPVSIDNGLFVDDFPVTENAAVRSANQSVNSTDVRDIGVGVHCAR